MAGGELMPGNAFATEDKIRVRVRELGRLGDADNPYRIISRDVYIRDVNALLRQIDQQRRENAR